MTGKCLKPSDIMWLDSATDDALHELRSADARVVIFGCGEIGKLLLDVCRDAGIAIAAFCDNNPGPAGESYGGVPVVHPEQAARPPFRETFVIAMHTEKNLLAALTQLSGLGVKKAYNARLLERLHRFSATPTTKNGDWEKWTLARKVGIGHAAFNPYHGTMTISDLGCHITDACTLNCRDCGSFIPHFKQAGPLSTDDIKWGIDAMCSAADHIVTLGIIGGEPLSHPEVHLIARHAASQPKIGMVSITTNGTVIPREDQWDDLRNEKVVFRISNYGEHSRNLDSLCRQLNAHDVKGFVTHWKEWVEWRKIGRANRSREETGKHFQSCVFNKCFMLGGARLYRCGSMLAGVRAGIMPDYENDHVSLEPAPGAADAVSLREKIRRYLYDQDIIFACDWCPGYTSQSPIVKAAEQMPRRWRSGGERT